MINVTHNVSKGCEIKLRKVTLDDIARELGVSKSTVSRAISGKGRIGSSTKSEILDYVERIHFGPNTIAKGLAESKSKNIGLILTPDFIGLDVYIYQGFLKGITEITFEMGYDIIMCQILNNEASNLKRIIENRKVDGIILCGNHFPVCVIDYLNIAGIPFVIAGLSQYDNITHIDFNHREACREFTNVLILMGIKKTALIGGDVKYVKNQHQLNGYEDAIRERKITIHQDMIYMDIESFIKIEIVIEDILSKKAECIICMDPIICEKVLIVLEKKSIKIPDDIKVACFCNSKSLTYNNITCLNFDTKELGAAVVKALIKQINNDEMELNCPLEYEIILKESTNF